MLKRISAIVDDRGDVIVAHDIAIPLDPGEGKELVFPLIIQELNAGKKIAAIRLFCALSGASLRDSKLAIELLDSAMSPLYERMDALTDELMCLHHEVYLEQHA